VILTVALPDLLMPKSGRGDAARLLATLLLPVPVIGDKPENLRGSNGGGAAGC